MAGFSDFFSAPAPAAAPAPAPAAAPAAAPAPGAAIPAPLPGAPAPAPTPAPAPLVGGDMTGGGAVSFADLMSGGDQVAAMDDASYAAAALAGMANFQPEAQQGGPAFDMAAMQTALNGDGTNPGTMNFMDGVDVAAFVDGLNGEDPAASVTAFAQQLQNNVVMGMAPMINQLVAEAMKHTQSSTITETHQNLTSSTIITDFNQRYPYASNPVIKGMLPNLANQLAQSAPAGTPPKQIADTLHRIFQGLGQGAKLPDNLAPSNSTTDMTNIF